MVIDAILNKGYEISAMQLFNLDKEATAEFMEVYKTVLPEYNAVVEHFITGPCIALEVRGPGDIVSEFRCEALFCLFFFLFFSLPVMLFLEVVVPCYC